MLFGGVGAGVSLGGAWITRTTQACDQMGAPFFLVPCQFHTQLTGLRQLGTATNDQFERPRCGATGLLGSPKNYRRRLRCVAPAMLLLAPNLE